MEFEINLAEELDRCAAFPTAKDPLIVLWNDIQFLGKSVLKRFRSSENGWMPYRPVLNALAEALFQESESPNGRLSLEPRRGSINSAYYPR